MNDGRMAEVIQHIRQLVRPEDSVGLADAELLRRWVASRDEAAFEVLLWRHGPMVLGVCRRVLRDVHEAEDAMQATFLALARKASSIGRRDAVAGWLYRVAFRAALQSRAQAARRPAHEESTLNDLSCAPNEDLVWNDLRPVLDQEIGRLATKYRVPFVLRYLEGRTNEEVAREIGCPLGTALSRLARARERLRLRLTRRGVALTAGALAASVAANSLAATMPNGIIGPLVRAATQVAAGQAPTAELVSANAAVLADKLLRGMAMTKMKVPIALMLTLGLVGAGSGTLAYRLTAGQPAARPSTAAIVSPSAEPQRKAESAPAPDDAAAARKAEEDRRVAAEKARMQALDEASMALRDAEDAYRALEQNWNKKRESEGFTAEMVRAEELFKMLQRIQTEEREREQANYRSRDTKDINPADPKGKEMQREYQELVQISRKHDEARLERLIEARVRKMRLEERQTQFDREMKQELEFANARVKSARQRVLRLEDASMPMGAEPRGTEDLQQKVDELIKGVSELRRAVERLQPAKNP